MIGIEVYWSLLEDPDWRWLFPGSLSDWMLLPIKCHGTLQTPVGRYDGNAPCENAWLFALSPSYVDQKGYLHKEARKKGAIWKWEKINGRAICASTIISHSDYWKMGADERWAVRKFWPQYAVFQSPILHFCSHPIHSHIHSVPHLEVFLVVCSQLLPHEQAPRPPVAPTSIPVIPVSSAFISSQVFLPSLYLVLIICFSTLNWPPFMAFWFVWRFIQLGVWSLQEILILF